MEALAWSKTGSMHIDIKTIEGACARYHDHSQDAVVEDPAAAASVHPGSEADVKGDSDYVEVDGFTLGAGRRTQRGSRPMPSQRIE